MCLIRSLKKDLFSHSRKGLLKVFTMSEFLWKATKNEHSSPERFPSLGILLI